MNGERATLAEGFQAGLVALRAQGLKPSDFAKRLAEQVCTGNTTPNEMTDALMAYHARKPQ